MKHPKNVDEYISNAPKETQEKLKQIRSIIKTTTPNSEEKISYGMPYYKYKGRLAYFAYAKTHVGLYLTPPIIKDFKKELEGYSTSTATIRFPLNKKLPITLIKKLIKTRVEMNNKTK